MSKCGQEALPEVRQWSVGPPKSWGAIRGHPGGLGVVRGPPRGLEVGGRPS